MRAPCTRIKGSTAALTPACMANSRCRKEERARSSLQWSSPATSKSWSRSSSGFASPYHIAEPRKKAAVGSPCVTRLRRSCTHLSSRFSEDPVLTFSRSSDTRTLTPSSIGGLESMLRSAKVRISNNECATSAADGRTSGLRLQQRSTTLTTCWSSDSFSNSPSRAGSLARWVAESVQPLGLQSPPANSRRERFRKHIPRSRSPSSRRPCRCCAVACVISGILELRSERHNRLHWCVP